MPMNPVATDETKRLMALSVLYDDAKMDKTMQVKAITCYYIMAMTAKTLSVAKQAGTTAVLWCGRHMVDNPTNLAVIIMTNAENVFSMNATSVNVPPGTITLPDLVMEMITTAVKTRPADCKYACTACGKALTLNADGLPEMACITKVAARVIFASATCPNNTECRLKQDAYITERLCTKR